MALSLAQAAHPLFMLQAQGVALTHSTLPKSALVGVVAWCTNAPSCEARMGRPRPRGGLAAVQVLEHYDGAYELLA